MTGSIQAVEELLNHKFKNRKLLEDALAWISCDKEEAYRWQALGYSALKLAFVSWAFNAYPQSGAKELSLVVNTNISTQKLAVVAVKHGLHRCLGDKVPDFASTLQEEETMANTIAAVAAAVFEDCECDVTSFWLVFKGLMEPIITLDELNQQQKPVSKVCQKEV